MARESDLTCDWHLHTRLSDGTASAEDMVARAAELGLTSISITDHDCIDAHRNGGLAKVAERCGVTVTTGVEIDCRHGELEPEVLGYGFDPEHSGLVERLERVQAQRWERFHFHAAALARAGLALDNDWVTSSGIRTAMRINLYQAFRAAGHEVEGGYRRFKRMLDELGTAPDVDKPSPAEAAALIRDAGGFALVAHPMFVDAAVEEVVQVAADAGCAGVELLYPYQVGNPGLKRAEVRDGYGRLFEALERVFPTGAVTTRGSDSHSPGEWPHRLAALRRWDKMLPEGIRVEGTE